MALASKLVSIFSKGAAARSVFGRVQGMSDVNIVVRDTGREGLELRGKYGGRPTCVRICLVWGSAWLTMRPNQALDYPINALRDRKMDRRSYERWRSSQDPEWDKGATETDRRYLSDHVFLGGGWKELRLFEAFPSDLQHRIIAAVESDTHGRFAVALSDLSGSELRLGIAERIFWVRDPVARIHHRLELAGKALDWMEAHVDS